MPTIKLGARPKSFARVVKAQDLDGSELLIPVTFKYRTRKEYGAWIDSLPPEPTAADAVVDGKFSAEAYVEKVSEWNANKVMQSVDVWMWSAALRASSSSARRCLPPPTPSTRTTRPLA